MKIAVVGTGVAGLSAARAFGAQGHDVMLFERLRGPGGRVATRRLTGIEMPRPLSGASLEFDHGAQYFTVRDDRFSATVAEWLRDRVVAKWTGRIVSFDGEGWDELEQETDRYVGTPGMGAIANAMADGLEVRYGHAIESLQPLLDTYDQVIVALPAPQALPLVAHISALEAKVSQVTMKPNWTVLAAFEEPVAARFDAAFVSGSALGWIARTDVQPNVTIDRKIFERPAPVAPAA